jgi:hypothetical protein
MAWTFEGAHDRADPHSVSRHRGAAKALKLRFRAA